MKETLKKVIPIIIAGAIIGGVIYDPDTIKPIDFNGTEIRFDYTDENKGETLLTYTNSPYIEKNTMYLALKNTSGKDQNVKYQAAFDGAADVVKLQEFVADVPYQVEVPDFGNRQQICKGGWKAAAPDDKDLKDFYKCTSDNELFLCQSLEGTTCNQIDVQIGSHSETRYKDMWLNIGEQTVEDLKSREVKDIPDHFVAKDQYNIFLLDGETKYFKATFNVPIQTKGQFYVSAFGDQGGYGTLDPWWDSTYGYCKKMTFKANGASGGIGTTTTSNGMNFVLIATTTDNDLRATSSGGYIQEVSTDWKRPFDLAFTNGTDCNSDGGTQLDHFVELYSSTTGAITAHIETAGMLSSTTDTYGLMYWGKDGGTDQNDETGTFDSSYVGYWTLGEYPLTALDSTANNHDADNVRNHTASTTCQIGYCANSPGTPIWSYISLGTSPMDGLTAFTVHTWIYNNITDSGIAFWSDWSTTQSLFRNDGTSILRALVSWSDGSTADTSIYTATGYSVNKWTQVTYVYDGSNLIAYTNTTRDDSAAASGKTVKTHTSGNQQRFGGGLSGSERDWKGKIDQYYLRNIAETYSDLRTKYNNESCSVCTITFGTTETMATGGTPSTPFVFIKDGRVNVKDAVYYPELIDSYSEANQDNTSQMGGSFTKYRGQTFTNTNAGYLHSAQFQLRKQGSPTGNVYVELYAHTGVFGNNGVPTGNPLATSSPLDISTLTTSLSIVNFTFPDGQQYPLAAATNYVIVLYYTDGDASNYLVTGYDASSPTHAGNTVNQTSEGSGWGSNNALDRIFYVYNTGPKQGTVRIKN